jgi:hypothetical protein
MNCGPCSKATTGQMACSEVDALQHVSACRRCRAACCSAARSRNDQRSGESMLVL